MEKKKNIAYTCTVRFSINENGKKKKVEAQINVSFVDNNSKNTEDVYGKEK